MSSCAAVRETIMNCFFHHFSKKKRIRNTKYYFRRQMIIGMSSHAEPRVAKKPARWKNRIRRQSWLPKSCNDPKKGSFRIEHRRRRKEAI